MNKVYAVYGEAGEYSDARWWLVCAFASAEEADDLVERLNAWIKQANERDGLTYITHLGRLELRWPHDAAGAEGKRRNEHNWWDEGEHEPEHPPADPGCRGNGDYSTVYSVQELPFGIGSVAAQAWAAGISTDEAKG